MVTVVLMCRELKMRKAYVEHLENLTLKKDDEKEELQARVLQQVTGTARFSKTFD